MQILGMVPEELRNGHKHLSQNQCNPCIVSDPLLYLPGMSAELVSGYRRQQWRAPYSELQRVLSYLTASGEGCSPGKQTGAAPGARAVEAAPEQDRVHPMSCMPAHHTQSWHGVDGLP